MSNWDALGVQMAWFSSDARHVDASSLYTDLVGAEPDSFQKNKVSTPAIPHLSAASGSIESLNYQLTVQAGRVDLMVHPNATEPANLPQLIPEPEKLVLALVARGKLVGSRLKAINRLALVTTVAKPAESHAEANDLIAKQFGLHLPRTDVSDFGFQVNLRLPSGVNDLVLNRLLKFNVGGFQSVFVEVGVQGITPQSVQSYAATLMIDVNTVPRLNPLSEDEQAAIWTVIGSEAMRLRAVGMLQGLWEQ